ncbi:MAG: S8 family serine peptidase, partial [Blastocatellia bacterium]
MKKQFAVFVGAVVLLFTFAPVLVVYPQRVSDQPAVNLAAAQDIRSLALSPARAVANFVLQDPPVVAQQRTVHPEIHKGEKLQLESIDALAYETQLRTRQRGFESEVFQAFPDARIVTELRKLVNVVAIEAPGWELARMANLAGVSEARVAQQYHAVLDKSVPLINAPALWNKLGGSQLAGQGVKIAILDTGIDLSNPLFSDSGFTYPAGFPRGNPAFVNKKVIAAKAFISDPSADPTDANGHGTNVAGIAAGDFDTPTPLGPISGVAPAAYLGNYRVLDSSGAGSEPLIAAGLEDAVSDGFDIGSMSLGGPASPQPSV